VDQKTESCSPLTNHETFSTVLVEIGTPAQRFNLVADTGSNDVIVQSCTCKVQGLCPEEFGKCFSGAKNKSSTFALEGAGTPAGPAVMLMSFGSGDIAAAISSDNVVVGQESAFMKDSLLLMVEQQLDITGQFEGILGLGRPEPDRMQLAAGLPSKMAKEIMEQPEIMGFLEATGTDRFSMCFNYEGDGVLGLNTAEPAQSMGSVGQEHWGLDFRGISVGNKEQAVTFCDPATKKKSQETACGIIPDSGTTLIMGPEIQILKLYDELCKGWSRCKAVHEELASKIHSLKHNQQLEVPDLGLVQQPGDGITEEEWEEVLQAMGAAMGGGETQYESEGVQSIDMATTFQLLIQNCGRWANSSDSVDEIPSLFFQVAGNSGGSQALEMKASSWVLKSTEEIVHKETKKFMGIIPIEVVTRAEETICMPAFGPMDYPTELNGDVWIMGTPLFYEYTVHYDRTADPPAMFFSQEGCGSCVDSELKQDASLLGSDRTLQKQKLRKLTKPPVARKFDPSRPF